MLIDAIGNEIEHFHSGVDIRFHIDNSTTITLVLIKYPGIRKLKGIIKQLIVPSQRKAELTYHYHNNNCHPLVARLMNTLKNRFSGLVECSRIYLRYASFVMNVSGPKR